MSVDSSVQQPDPPLPNRISPIRQMSAEEARGATIGMLVLSAVLVASAALAWFFGHAVAAGILGVLGLVLGVSAFSKKSLISACPFCNAKLTGITQDAATKGRVVRCNECFEYSQAGGMKVRPMDPGKVADKPVFIAPVFEGGNWPQGCVLCGEPATRHDELTARSIVHPASLAAGRLWLSSTTMKNVPYCAQHKDALELSVNQSKQLDLKWQSLRMMRRYLAANRGKKSLGSKVHFNVGQP